MKNQYIGGWGVLPKKWGLGHFADLRRLVVKEGG